MNTTLARSSDPETSHQGAAHIAPKLGKLHAWAEGVVYQYPGNTVNEMAEKLHLRDNRMLGRRLSELAKHDLVHVGTARPCRITGRSAQTYHPGATFHCPTCGPALLALKRRS